MRNRMKKLLAVALVMGMVMTALAGCGAEKSNENVAGEVAEEQENVASEGTEEAVNGTGAAKGATVRYAISYDPGSLSPWAMTMAGYAVYPSVYESLFAYDSLGGEIKPQIGKELIATDDPLVYQVKIFDYVQDSQGNPLTAADVKFSIDSCKATKTWADLNYVDSVDVIDDTTVELHFNQVMSGTVNSVMTQTVIITQAAYEASADEMTSEPVGTGAYVVTEYVKGSKISMSKNENYWQTDEEYLNPCSVANVDNIDYMVIGNPTQIANSLQSGDIDLASVDSANLGFFMSDGEALDGYTVDQRMTNLIYGLMFNCSDNSECNNQLLRQAICYAVDKQMLIDGAADGLGVPCVTFGNSTFPGYQSKWEEEDYYNFDLEKAKELLAESGFDTGKTLKLMTSNDTTASMAAQIVQAELLELGLNVELISYESVMFTTTQEDPTQWDILINIFGSSGILANIYNYPFNTNNHDYGNYCFSKDEQLQEKYDTVMAIGGNTEENMDALHSYVKESAQGIGLWSMVSTYIADEDITSVFFPERPFAIPGPCTYNDSFGL